MNVIIVCCKQVVAASRVDDLFHQTNLWTSAKNVGEILANYDQVWEEPLVTLRASVVTGSLSVFLWFPDHSILILPWKTQFLFSSRVSHGIFVHPKCFTFSGARSCWTSTTKGSFGRSPRRSARLGYARPLKCGVTCGWFRAYLTYFLSDFWRHTCGNVSRMCWWNTIIRIIRVQSGWLGGFEAPTWMVLETWGKWKIVKGHMVFSDPNKNVMARQDIARPNSATSRGMPLQRPHAHTQSDRVIYLPIYLSVCLSVYLSIYLSLYNIYIYVYTYMCIHIYIYRCVYIYIYI